MKLIKKFTTIILRLGVSALLLFLVFKQMDQQSAFAVMKGADKGMLCVSFLLFLASYVIAFWRWEMLLKTLKIDLPLRRIISPYAGGIFFNLFLPSTIGGDFMRSIDLGRYTKRPREVIATVFLDRLSGYAALVILALIAVCLGWGMGLLRDLSVIVAVGVIGILLGLILLVLYNNWVYAFINTLLDSPKAGKLREAIKNLHEEIYKFRQHKGIIARNIILSLIVQGLNPIAVYLIAQAFGIHASIIYFFIFLPIISAITLLPISIGGLGLRDVTTVIFFAKIGVAKNMAFATSLTSFFFIALCGGIGGIIYVLTLHHRRVQRSEP